MATPATLSTVPAQTPYIQYVATSGQTVFPYPFEITQDSDLVVVDNGVTYDTDAGYTVSGVGNPTGGNVTLNTGATAGDIVTLYRDIPIERLTQFAQNGGFSSAAFNAEFNNVYLLLQQLQQGIDQCLQIPNTNNPAPTVSLTPASYAGKYLSFDANGNPTPALLTPSGSLTAAIIGGLVAPETPAETNAGLTVSFPQYEVGNVLRYGIVPNSAGAAASNAVILAQLLDPTKSGPTGRIYFPNITGADTYYIGGIIQVRDGCRLDLCGTTIEFTKTFASSDNFMGFFTFIRDVTIESGGITVNYDGSSGTNAGLVMRIGSRSGYPFGSYTNGIFDQDDLVANGLPPMGNITLRDLRITSNNTGPSEMIAMLGGLRGVYTENLVFNGQSAMEYAIYYEFGFASANGQPGTQTAWTSSHACDMEFHNTTATNLKTSGATEGGAIGLVGAHTSVVDGVVVDSAWAAVRVYPGEALFFRVWSPTDTVGQKHSTTVRRVVASNISATGLDLIGADTQAGGYLATVALTPSQMRDLMTFTVEDCTVSAAGAGAFMSGNFNMRNVRLNGAASSGQIIITDDIDRFSIENCQFTGSSGVGIRGTFGTVVAVDTTITAGTASIAAPGTNFTANEPVIFTTGSMGAVTGIVAAQIYYVSATGLSASAFQVSATPGGSVITPGGTGIATPIVAPARLKRGVVNSSLIAGNSIIGVQWGTCQGIEMTACRIGYSVEYDGVAETTQTDGVEVLGAQAGGAVFCRECLVRTNSGTAYAFTGTIQTGVCGLYNPQGELTTSGFWEINGVGQASATQIGIASAYPNIGGSKMAGKMCYDSTDHLMYVAVGPNPTDKWYRTSDGITTITPA